MPPKSQTKKGKAAPEKPVQVTITVNGRSLPLVRDRDLTIDDQIDIRAATGTTWRDWFPAQKVLSAQMDAGMIAVWWWMARRHAGENVSFQSAKTEVESLSEFKIGTAELDESDPES